jgi:uncharacterized protein (TIGR03086 family)
MTASADPPGRSPAHCRLTTAIDYADAVLDAVTARQLSQPTPCRAWNLHMLLEHVDESLGTLHEGITAGQVAAHPARPTALPNSANSANSAAALVGVFRRRAAALLDASAQADSDVPVTIGGQLMPLDCLRTVGALEITVHAWDVSQACGQRLTIPEEPASDLLAQAFLLVPRLGRAPLFGAPTLAPSRSTSSDLLAAYLGRSAW